MTNNVLCSISTRGRYDSTLPLTLQSVATQTVPPDHLVIFDDNDDPIDLRENQMYYYLFQMLDERGIKWAVVFGERKGQHYNHQKANQMGHKWVWRLDDDTVANPDTLEILLSHTADDVGAVGGAILTPPIKTKKIEATGLIDNISSEPNIQWGYIDEVKEVDHLHCSFLYRAGIMDYNLGLSPRAFREETLFTYGLRVKGYRVLVVPTVTWHLQNAKGGIRTNIAEYKNL